MTGSTEIHAAPFLALKTPYYYEGERAAGIEIYRYIWLVPGGQSLTTHDKEENVGSGASWWNVTEAQVSCRSFMDDPAKYSDLGKYDVLRICIELLRFKLTLKF